MNQKKLSDYKCKKCGNKKLILVGYFPKKPACEKCGSSEVALLTKEDKES